MFCAGRLVLFLSLPSALLALVPGAVVINKILLFLVVLFCHNTIELTAYFNAWGEAQNYRNCL